MLSRTNAQATRDYFCFFLKPTNCSTELIHVYEFAWPVILVYDFALLVMCSVCRANQTRQFFHMVMTCSATYLVG